MQIISVFSQKGGVGKTTTTVNLAAAFALEGYKVGIVDNDPQGNSSDTFGVYESEKTIYDVMIRGYSMKDALVKTNIENLWILPGNIDYAKAEIDLINMMNRERIIDRAIKKAKLDFDFLFIDCPPSLGIISINALAASDFAIIPIKIGKYALRGLNNIFETVDQVKNELNENIKIMGAVLTQYEKGTNVSKKVVPKITEAMQDLLFDSYIPKATKVIDSEFEEKPIVIFDKNNSAAIKYTELAKEVLSRAKSK
jgi:chromosome partitioning protein